MFTPRTNQTSVRCKTEADFAIYIKELMQLGIKGYDSLIIDGRVLLRWCDHEASTEIKIRPFIISLTVRRALIWVSCHAWKRSNRHMLLPTGCPMWYCKSYWYYRDICTYLSNEGVMRLQIENFRFNYSLIWVKKISTSQLIKSLTQNPFD
jgi:hypothetical protein